jgi:hypothetical protein
MVDDKIIDTLIKATEKWTDNTLTFKERLLVMDFVIKMELLKSGQELKNDPMKYLFLGYYIYYCLENMNSSSVIGPD